MEYVDSENLDSDNEQAEIVMGNITKCFAVWVTLSIITVTTCFFVAKIIGDLWPDLTLFILISLSISISLLLFVSLSIGCVHRLRKRTLCWKRSILYSLVAFMVTTMIASGLIELVKILVNKGIH